MKKYTCACCGFKTLSEKNGSYEICTVCSWEDDGVMNDNPDYWGGANDVCLRQAQRNYIEFGASDKRFKGKLVTGFYEKDSLWKPVWEREARLSKTKIVEIQIEGNVLINGHKESMRINEFIDEFTALLESKGWSFGGEIKQVSTQINKPNNVPK